ncbi:hypothetical protein RV12_GL000097 [Enterococcus quebecensis]|uniref:Uncharacterized protein n=1 Tax=Enterococcus quebecensis TaxID=903983 RepID=A0A1E5H334_9ENTE|nr:hypothetical protein BCR23_01145 [Enterococcus quebecensis]OJG75758.1 hypothetical protein RV12_GL000097 [Enterococcus quebecensis]
MKKVAENILFFLNFFKRKHNTLSETLLIPSIYDIKQTDKYWEFIYYVLQTINYLLLDKTQ